MLSAIWRICFFECVRALRGLGLSSSGETHSILCMSPPLPLGPEVHECSPAQALGSNFEELRLRIQVQLSRITANWVLASPLAI
jgi:hypothetical protein